MEEKVQAEEGISLLDLVKLLLSKIKLLILVVLIAGIAGGSFALWRFYETKYFGTKVEFYVNPDKPKDVATEGGSQYGVYGAYGRHVMDNIVKLLSSESFAEQLMLEENGLPTNAENYWETETEEFGLEEKINHADTVLRAAKKEMTAAEKLVQAKTDAVALLNTEWRKLAGDTPFSEFEYNKLDKSGAEYASLVNAYNVAKQKTEEANTAVTNALKVQEQADAVREEVLVEWRKTSKYLTMLSRFKSSASYSYLQTGEDVDDANNLARSFIYVTISVLGDEAFANDLLERVRRVVPSYVEENMAIPSDYTGTNCQRITRTDAIVRTNPNFRTKQVIKYGILLAAVAFLVACVAIIIVDRSDKRLRDYESVMRALNVPVLGVVPTIESIEELAKQKKQAKKNKPNANTEVK